MITVILPTYQEADRIAGTLEAVRQADRDHLVRQTVVADGGSRDGTAELAQAAGAEVVRCSKGRARQCNAGASQATEPVLFFLHADTEPPAGFSSSIRRSLELGFGCGCFRLSFRNPHPLLHFCAWFTRFNCNWMRFGDQGLFVRRDLFRAIGGYREDMQVMEDQEIVVRLRKRAQFTVLPEYACTSSRKYRENGVFRTQLAFGIVWALYSLGWSQEDLVGVYRRLIRSEQLG